MARIISLGIGILLLAGLFAWPTPVSAGSCVWSAESIPSILGNVLGPAGIDIRDLAIGNDELTIYAAPGDSITDITAGNVTYKSTDGGLTWTKLASPIRVDYIAVAPDNINLVAIANNISQEVFISTTGGLLWQSLGIVKEGPGGNPPTAIFDLGISPIRGDIHYITVAGKQAGNIANLWYFDFGAMIPAWYETNTLNGFSPASEVATLAFSPRFATDATVVTITDNASSNVTLQMFKYNTRLWNTIAGFTGYPYTVITANLSRLTSASLALDLNYTSDDPDTRKVFIGLTIDGDAAANTTSGIYRLEDTVQTNLVLNTKIHSISFDGSYFVAGSWDTTSVYLCKNPYALAPTVSLSAPSKHPGGVDKTIVAWLGSSVIAGTSGDESAFSVSEDYGVMFDDISLVDTAISIARDFAVSRDGSKIYLVSENGTDTSLWCFDTIWRRVNLIKGVVNFTVRITPNNSSVVYFAERGSNNVSYNSASGRTQWLSRTCPVIIQDMAAESSQALYVIDAAGIATKNINSGLLWTNTHTTNLASGATIVSVNTNIVLAGSQDGYVSYSLDGGATWTKIPQKVEEAAGKIQVIADENFNQNKIIYAASDTPGSNIMKWIIGTSITWTDIFAGNIAGGIYGLATSNNILYALEYNAVSGQSTLWRHIAPAFTTAASREWTASTTNATTDATDLTVALNAVPQALKASARKVWAIKTNGTNRLYSWTDVIGDIEITTLTPENGYSDIINTFTTVPYDIVFSWARPSVATGYELLISPDSAFAYGVTTIIVNMEDDIAYVTVGPNQTGVQHLVFTYGATYYWKVRVNAPGYSSYSEIWHFTINTLQDMDIGPLIHIQGQMPAGTYPTFSWLPLQDITEYQFRLSDNPVMKSPVVDILVQTTSIRINIALIDGETYFWQVRATQPVKSLWSALGVFTFIKTVEPQAPVIVEEGTQETITIPYTAPAQPFLSIFSTGHQFLIIFIIVVALVAVITLLVLGRLPFKLPGFMERKERPVGPARAPKTEPTRPQARPETRIEPLRPQARTEPRAEIPKTPAAPETTAPHAPLIEKDKEGAAVIFAAKSFIWMAAEEEAAGGGQTKLTEKERQSLGKKVADRIHALTKKENIYTKYPGDALMLLKTWAQYGSRKETDNYLVKTFESNPYNVIKLLKIYLPAAQPGREPPSAEAFTMTQYASVAEIVDPDRIYAALTKIFKFKADTIEEKTPVIPADRDLAFQFMRLHFKARGVE